MEEEIKYLQRFIDKCKLRGYEFYGILHSPHFEILQNLINKNKELEKVIELMAKDIAENKLDEDICSKVRSPEKEECDCYADMYDACYGCVIEYYEKKAKGE